MAPQRQDENRVSFGLEENRRIIHHLADIDMPSCCCLRDNNVCTLDINIIILKFLICLILILEWRFTHFNLLPVDVRGVKSKA